MILALCYLIRIVYITKFNTMLEVTCNVIDTATKLVNISDFSYIVIWEY